MKVFYGAAIQGAEKRKKRAYIHKTIIDTIKKQGFEVFTEHTTGTTYQEAIEKLEKSIGKMPKDNLKRRNFVRNKMIEAIESNIAAAIFEVSTSSLGTGIEIAHAYLRSRMGIKKFPFLYYMKKITGQINYQQ